MTLKGKKLVWIFLAIFAFISGNKCIAQNPDIDILKSINPQHPTSLYWRNTSNSAYYGAATATFGTLIYGIVANDATAKQNGIETFINLGASVAITQILKSSINRTRPADRYPNDVFVLSATHNQSFPSGHTSLAFATATTLALQYHKWYVSVPAYLWASSVGYSRMYLGKHYPTDVLAGAAVGIGTTYACNWLNKKLFVNRHKTLSNHD